MYLQTVDVTKVMYCNHKFRDVTQHPIYYWGKHWHWRWL